MAKGSQKSVVACMSVIGNGTVRIWMFVLCTSGAIHENNIGNYIELQC